MNKFGPWIWILILVLTACGVPEPDQTVDLAQTASPSSGMTQQAATQTLISSPPGEPTRENTSVPVETPLPTASLPPTSTSTQPQSTFPFFSPGETPRFTQIHMADETNGWALAESERAVSHLLRTADGGKTWREVTPPFPPALANPIRSVPLVAFLDSKHAWVIFTTDEPYPPIPLTVFSTTDGGVTWENSQPLKPEPEMEGFDPQFLQFADPSTGWLMVAHGAAAGSAPISLYQTIDGGATWQRIQEPLGPDSGTINVCCQSGMLFTTPTQGVITSFAGPISEPRLNWTQDGGRTWQSQNLPPPLPTEASFCSTSSPQAPHDSQLYILVECLFEDQVETTAYLYSTFDRGQNWLIQPLPTAPLRNGEWLDGNRERRISFPGPDAGWYIVLDTHFDLDGNPDKARSFIYKTADGGRSWQALSQTAWAADFSFLEQGLVWAAAHKGDSTALVFSANSGRAWQIIEPKITSREEP